MKLNADSFLFKYAFLFNGNKNLVNRTSLCQLFWRCVLVTFSLSLPLLAICVYIYALIVDFKGTAVSTLFVASVMAGASLIGYIDNTLRMRKIEKWEKTCDPNYVSPAPGLIETTLYAIKNKVCPIITIVRD